MRKYLSIFLSNYSSLLENLPQCTFSKYECQLIEEDIFVELSHKNKYTALDIPDNKNLILQKVKFSLVYSSFSKIVHLGKMNYRDINNIPSIISNKSTFEIVIFEFGQLPIVKNNKINKALFLVNYPSRKVYFFGFIDLQKIDFGNLEISEPINGMAQNYLLKKIDGLNFFIND